MNYSLAKISAELGVSKTAVSLILNGKGRENGLSTRLEKKVLNFCQRVGYRQNIHAKRINSTLAQNIGVLLDTRVSSGETPFEEPNTALMVGGIAEAAAQSGFRFTVQLHHPAADDEPVFEWLRNRETDGLIFYGFGMPAEWLRVFAAEKRQVVGIGISPARGLPCVNADNFGGTYALTQRLIERGRRKFLFVAGVASHPGDERQRGFLHALAEAGLQPVAELPGQFGEETARRLVAERLATGRFGEDAVVCANDAMAVGVLRALQAAGRRVPEEVAVVGADNLKLGQYVTPALTTFDYSPYEQGRAAFNLLRAMLNGEQPEPQVVLPATCRWRESG